MTMMSRRELVLVFALGTRLQEEGSSVIDLRKEKGQLDSGQCRKYRRTVEQLSQFWNLIPREVLIYVVIVQSVATHVYGVLMRNMR